MDSTWRDAAEKLLNSVPFEDADAATIVIRCQQLPRDARSQIMVAALAERFGALAGLNSDEYDACVRGPGLTVTRPGRHLRAV